MDLCTQCIVADWAHDRRQSELTLHNRAVMAMGFLVAQDNPSTAEIEKSDHTRGRTWVVAATTRRPNHKTIWSHAAWAVSRYSATRAHTQHIRAAIQPRRFCWPVIASQIAQPPDQRRASGFGTSDARPTVWGPRLHAASAATARPTTLSSVRPTACASHPKPLQGGQQQVTRIPPQLPTF